MIVPGLLLLTVVIDRPRLEQPSHEAEWLTAGDADVRTIRAGVGDTTILLVHGFGESLLTWRSVFDPLARHHRVVAIDLPGFGGSDKPDASYSLEAMDRRMSAFIDSWTEGPLVVVGHSMGGEIAASLALSRPDRVAALILIAPSGWDLGLAGIADSMDPTTARALGWYLSGRAVILPDHDRDWLHEPPRRASYSLIADPSYRRSASRVLEEFDFAALRTRFAEVVQPTLLVWGTLDPVIPFALADSVASRIPCSRLHALPNALHRPQVEVPDTVVSIIEEFLRTPPACRGSRVD